MMTGRLIDADALLKKLRRDPLFELVEQYGISGVIENAPTVDAVPVIRCKDCKYYRYVLGYIDGLCGRVEWYKRYQREDDYCSRAERKKNDRT